MPCPWIFVLAPFAARCPRAGSRADRRPDSQWDDRRTQEPRGTHLLPGRSRDREREEWIATMSMFCLKNWSRRSGLNGRPADYESAALPTELRRLGLTE